MQRPHQRGNARNWWGYQKEATRSLGKRMKSVQQKPLEDLRLHKDARVLARNMVIGAFTICRLIYRAMISKAGKKQKRKDREAVCLHFSNSKISPSLLTPFSTSMFFCLFVSFCFSVFVVFNDSAGEFGIIDGNCKGTNWQTRGNSQITLIRVCTCSSLTLETRNSAPIFKSLWRQHDTVQIDTEVFILVLPFFLRICNSEQLFCKGGR